MQVLAVIAAVALGEGVDLDSEGDALLAAVLAGGELCADAVHLRTGGKSVCLALVNRPYNDLTMMLLVCVCVGE